MLVQTTTPAIEPVSLAEARLHLRMTVDDSAEEDALIKMYIAAARRHAEAYCGLSLITQGWRLVLDRFPRCLELERGPVQRIEEITYRDMAGVGQTIAWGAPSGSIQRSLDNTLVADLSGAVARIAPAFGHMWPVALPEIGSVSTTYRTGFGSDAAVPEGIKSWILLRVARLFSEREEIVDGKVASSYLDGLLDPYTVPRA